jgi:hypothetical protein
VLRGVGVHSASDLLGIDGGRADAPPPAPGG